MGPAEMFDRLALRTKTGAVNHTVPFGTLLTARLFQAFRAWLPSLVPLGQQLALEIRCGTSPSAPAPFFLTAICAQFS
jgi:hypothetical protein